MEVIKVVTGLGEPLAGRLLLFDLRDMRFRTLPISRSSDCARCGGVKAEKNTRPETESTG